MDSEGSRVQRRIVECHLDVQMSEIEPAITLRHMHCLTAGMPHGIKRRAVVESARFDDESVAFPAANGISKISRKLKSGRESASVRKHLAMEAIDFVYNHRLFGRLNDFERFGKQACDGPAVLAVANIVGALLGGTALHRCLALRRQQRLPGLQIKENVDPVLVHRFEFHSNQCRSRLGFVRGAEDLFVVSDTSALVRPHTRQVQLAVYRARSGSGEIRFSVLEARHARVRVVQPLGVGGNRQEKRRRQQPPKHLF